MRKLLTIAASAVALTGASVASADTVMFSGTLGAVATPGNTSIDASPIGNMGGQMFSIEIEYDGDTLTGATIMIMEDGTTTTDDAEVFRADVFNVDSDNAGVLDTLSIDLRSTDGPLVGNFDLDFEFINTALSSDDLSDAFAALSDVGQLICSHIMFNFGGFKYEGTIVDGGITFNPVDPIPLPGAAVFMISGLAAAGVARRRRA